MTTTKPTNANAISRLLKRAGFHPTSDHRGEGVRVSRGPLKGTAVVSVDIDMPHRRDRLADAVNETLTEAGYDFDRMRPHYFHINGRKADDTSTHAYECPDCGEGHDGMTTGTEHCPGCAE